MGRPAQRVEGAGPRDNEFKSLPVESGNLLRRGDLHIDEDSIPSELTKLKNSGVDKLLKASGQLSATVIEQGLGSIDDLTVKLDLMEPEAKTLPSGKLEIGEVRDFDIESRKNFTES